MTNTIKITVERDGKTISKSYPLDPIMRLPQRIIGDGLALNLRAILEELDKKAEPVVDKVQKRD